MGEQRPDGTDDAAALLSWLATRDAHCPVCGYNVRGIPEARCPECAAPLQLHVWSENAGIGPWLLAIVSFSLAAGFDGVVTTMLVGACVVDPPPPPAWGWVATLLGSFAILSALCLGGVLLLATRRRRFWRLPRRRQWTAAMVTFGAVGAFHAAFGAFLIVVGS